MEGSRDKLGHIVDAIDKAIVLHSCTIDAANQVLFLWSYLLVFGMLTLMLMM